MKLTVKVEVGTVYPPSDINVYIREVDTKKEYTFSSDKSFEKDFNLPDGKYYIKIQGANQKNDTTKVTLSGATQREKSTAEPFYSIFFLIKIP
ncbi:hypothetical protein [Flavobacterium sp.]|uniref:hypothetical protein n=1 Tax=Flavobacterium sp. TaxID=239 RepID=UPI0011FCC89E|nr:hypothetical protein [Flavobacterium sp.]RZJ70512.1 MAG: hypothetical protein EOO49_13715 [Flavobacterium sp.]